jgi:hypothetical protein
LDDAARSWAVRTIMKHSRGREGFWFPDPLWPENRMLVGRDREHGVVIYQMLPPNAFAGTEHECRTIDQRFDHVHTAEHPEDPVVVVLARWYRRTLDFSVAADRVREAARAILEGRDPVRD